MSVIEIRPSLAAKISSLRMIYYRQLPLSNYACEKSAGPDSISTSIRQLSVLQHSFVASDAYQHPGKWCEVMSPMCTPSNRLCEATATYWHLTLAGYDELEGITFLLVITIVYRERADLRESSWSLLLQ
jgi:hypothetical protein